MSPQPLQPDLHPFQFSGAALNQEQCGAGGAAWPWALWEQLPLGAVPSWAPGHSRGGHRASLANRPASAGVSPWCHPQTTLRHLSCLHSSIQPSMACFLMALTCHHTKPPREAQAKGSPSQLLLSSLTWWSLHFFCLFHSPAASGSGEGDIGRGREEILAEGEEKYWQLPLIRFLLPSFKIIFFWHRYSSSVIFLSLVT